MNPNEARIIDPILTNHAKAYTNQDFVLGAIFPTVPVNQRGGNVITFDKNAFRRFNSRRAPGTDTKRIQVGYAGEPIAVRQDSLEALVPFEIQDESSKIGIDLQAASVDTVLASMGLNTEYERAKLATDASKYSTDHKVALSGTDQWTDPTADLKAQINDAREKVRKDTGHYPNVMTVSPGAFLAAQENENVLKKFQYSSSLSVTAEIMANYFDVDQVVIPKAVSLPDGASDSDSFEDVWGNFVHLAYVPKTVSGIHQPSFGYTYQLIGSPRVEQAYYDKRAKSMAYPVTVEERAYLTSVKAGFLFSNVVGS